MKLSFAWLFHVLGVTRFAAWWHRKDVVILNYHGINVTDKGSHAPSLLDLSVSRENFTAQITYLRRRHHVISLGDFLTARAAARKLPDYSVVLTFDDGYRDFLTVAPLLVELNLPATLFLVTDMMRGEDSGSESLPKDADRLSWTEVGALDEHGIFEFGSHTRSHTSLTGLSREELDHELRESLHELSRRVKNVVPALAYPNGAHSGVSTENIAAAGYACALTIDAGPNQLRTNPYFLRRQTIRGEDDKDMFVARLSCLTPWLYSLRKRKNAFLNGRAVMATQSFKDDKAAAGLEGS